MDSSQGLKPTQAADYLITAQLSTNSSTKRSNSLASTSDLVTANMDGVYKSLTVLGDKVISKLNELLAAEVPEGITSLNPEEHTAEATAQRIADGTTALFSIYAKQNPDKDGEELISSFMETIRGGIKDGYNEAMAALGDIGALDIDGVSSSIEKTMALVEEKLKAYEDTYRQNNGLSTKTAVTEAKSSSSSEVTISKLDETIA